MMTQWSFTYLGTLIQSTFTYEEWIGYDIIFFKIPAALLTCKQNNSTANTTEFQISIFFQVILYPVFLQTLVSYLNIKFQNFLVQII